MTGKVSTSCELPLTLNTPCSMLVCSGPDFESANFRVRAEFQCLSGVVCLAANRESEVRLFTPENPSMFSVRQTGRGGVGGGQQTVHKS